MAVIERLELPLIMTRMRSFTSLNHSACFVFLLALSTLAIAADGVVFTDPLPTGVRLDAVGEAVELGSVPLGMAVAPGGDKAAVVLSGWREQGVQFVDLKSRRVTQTLEQSAAFLGVAF